MILPKGQGKRCSMVMFDAPAGKSFAVALALGLTVFAVAPARAGECEACRSEDLNQVGPYTLDENAVRKGPDFSEELRGKARKIPLPGVGQATVHVKPGAGLWIGRAGENLGDLFLDGTKSGAKAGWRVGF